MEINEALTIQDYIIQCSSLARNVFVLDNLPTENQLIPFDKDYFNKIKLQTGSVLVFRDEEMGLVCSKWESQGKVDFYNNPVPVVALGGNGYRRVLKPDEYVLIWDNTSHVSLMPMIIHYATRLAKARMTCDVNIRQQKTPRLFQVPTGKEQTFKQLVKKIDNNEDVIFAYKDMFSEKIETILSPAPYVADKVEEYSEVIWNEFCRVVGISNIVEQKKERMITDEVENLRSGHIVARYDRLTPLKDGIDKVNKKFKTDIKVTFYDDLSEGDEENAFDSQDKGGAEDDAT